MPPSTLHALTKASFLPQHSSVRAVSFPPQPQFPHGPSERVLPPHLLLSRPPIPKQLLPSKPLPPSLSKEHQVATTSFTRPPFTFSLTQPVPLTVSSFMPLTELDSQHLLPPTFAATLILAVFLKSHHHPTVT